MATIPLLGRQVLGLNPPSTDILVRLPERQQVQRTGHYATRP